MNYSRLACSLLTRIPWFPIWPKFADLEGIRVPIRDSAFPPRLRRHLMRGGYETDERRLVQEFVSEGDRVLELGASSGIVTSFLWRQVGSGGRVVSVEGNGALKPYFDRVLSENGFSGEWIDAICFPVWSDVVPESFRSRGFAAASNPLGGMVGSGQDELSTPGPTALSLKQISERADLRPSVLIADIEGTEGVWCETPPVLPESIKTVIIEIHPQLVGVASAGATIQALVDEKFRVAGISGEVLALTRG